MTIQTKYQIKRDGKWIDSSGVAILTPEAQPAAFDTLEDVSNFLAASGSIGNYDIEIISKVGE